MNNGAPVAPTADGGVRSPFRAGCELFLISVLLLFLELACIRWFPAHVLYLTFFTNTVLLACFLGMSVGCLAAGRARNYLTWTPVLLVVALAAGHLVESLQSRLGVDVGNQAYPQLVFFGTEYNVEDVSRFFIPIEVLGGFFFLMLALAFVGPGQELGRALNRLPNRVQAYTLNILGSVVGIVLFAACSRWELAPFWWFLPIVAGLGYFLACLSSFRRSSVRWTLMATLAAVLGLASMTSGTFGQNGRVRGKHFWSPYYRIDYDVPPRSAITVNLIGHQQMVSRSDAHSPAYAYALPYLLDRDAGQRRFEDVLIIGAGSGNDVSRALQWGVRHVDAVEIDPVILRLGQEDHPDRPYQDTRVTVHLDDGRNFLRATNRKYDLIVYALVDSLVLHSSYSNIRLESYLFTRQAFADVRRCLKPGGVFVMYNYFRWGWIVHRLQEGLKGSFGAEPLVLTLPYRATVGPELRGGFTMFVAGANEPLRSAFQKQSAYWLRDGQSPGPDSPNGFEQHPQPEEQRQWVRFGLATLARPEELRTPSDDWPFLYLHQPMIPRLSLQGMAIMAGLALLLIAKFLPERRQQGIRFAINGRMFFLGAGFMLVETKAVVHMALLFGSTWMVNTVVFFSVLVMILAANLFVLRVRPRRLWPYYAVLLATLALNSLVPLDFFLGMERTVQVVGSCLMVFAPILFAGVVFAVSFGQSREPDLDFGANVAGAILGGFAENSSMLLGFQYLMLVAIVFYAMSALLHRSPSLARKSVVDPARV